MKHKPQVRAVRQIHIDDEELRALVFKIIEIDQCSRNITQALRNAAVSYYKELIKEQAYQHLAKEQAR